MASSSEELERRQEQRLAVLRYMYDVTARQEPDRLGMRRESNNIAEQLPYNPKETSLALDYLEGEGLIDVILSSTSGKIYQLTHGGVKAFEETLKKPEHGTDRFSPQVIYNVTATFNGPVGAYQTGSNAEAHVTQNIGADISSMFALIEQLRQQVDELPEDEQEEAQVNLDMLEAELKNDKEPKKIRVFVTRLAAIGRGTAAAVGFGANATTLMTQAQALGLF